MLQDIIDASDLQSKNHNNMNIVFNKLIHEYHICTVYIEQNGLIYRNIPQPVEILLLLDLMECFKWIQ